MTSINFIEREQIIDEVIKVLNSKEYEKRLEAEFRRNEKIHLHMTFDDFKLGLDNAAKNMKRL